MDLVREDAQGKLRSVSVDLNVDPSLQIDIPDALSEKDRVKFTVHTKTTLPAFQNPEFSVTRQHEDFVWLHDTLTETEEYAGLIIPPAPSKPDFDGPREKMQKLGEGEVSMTKEEFAKMKQELEAEYLAVFKKTVSSHEIFLQRISSHPVLSKDRNFHVFLEYDQDLSVRRKNTKEMFGGFLKSMVKSADEVLFSGVKEVEDFFEQEKTFLVNYYNRIKDACAKADKMTRSHKNVADDYIYTSACLNSLALEEPTVIKKSQTPREYERKGLCICSNVLLNTTTAYTRPSLSSGLLKFQNNRALLSYGNIVSFFKVNYSTFLNFAIYLPRLVNR
ncbi:sorting nexin-5 isoform X2 [Pezoporus wallicus]|uniref:sorting nexin-5 isoform X2 n=1 Tax=Pezoporus wallicus TaxID=35540 RepID=UPI00254DC7F3|nr:sorting nexin-5 isoform X2 [Pezoporus wallicus]